MRTQHDNRLDNTATRANFLKSVFAAARRKYPTAKIDGYVGSADGKHYMQVWGDNTQYFVTEELVRMVRVTA